MAGDLEAGLLSPHVTTSSGAATTAGGRAGPALARTPSRGAPIRPSLRESCPLGLELLGNWENCLLLGFLCLTFHLLVNPQPGFCLHWQLSRGHRGSGCCSLSRSDLKHLLHLPSNLASIPLHRLCLASALAPCPLHLCLLRVSGTWAWTLFYSSPFLASLHSHLFS